MHQWIETARIAEERGDFDHAITVLSAVAECYSSDATRHNAHLWHLDLLARAGRLLELATLGQEDVHARRRLNRLLYEEGRDEDLRQRAAVKECRSDGEVVVCEATSGGEEGPVGPRIITLSPCWPVPTVT